MVTALVDTNVVVDILREYAPALAWRSQQPRLAVTRAVWMEVLIGADNKREQYLAMRFLKTFELVLTLPSDWDWATDQLGAYNLSHAMGILDCLIAAPSFRLGIPLYTNNLKHFRPLLGDLAIKPY